MSISSVFVLGRSVKCQKLNLNVLNSDLSSEKISEVRNILKIDMERLATFVFVKNQQTKVTLIQMPISSIFKPETFFWCQKFRLGLLSSEHVSENCLEVGNILKIDLERYGDFRRLTATSGDLRRLTATSYLLKKLKNQQQNKQRKSNFVNF